MRMLLAGGGTGGHLFPAVALAQHLLAVDPEARVHFVGTARGIEARVLPQLGLPLTTIDIEGVVGRGWRAKLGLLPKLLRSVRQSQALLDTFRPDVVVGVGGYASAPALLAALLRKTPTLIHEQNAWPGLTNRLLARWVDRVCLSITDADRAFHYGRVVVTGNPLRVGMEECPPLPEAGPSLLVFGGSRGAKAINDLLLGALPALAPLRGTLNIRHQAGEEDLERVRQGYRDAGWEAEVVPFIEDMATAYRDAQLVVCRAGATTIAELTACGRPALLIPYPYAAADHQTANARALARRGAALMLPQADLTSELLARLLGDLLADRDRLQSMSGAARSLAKRGAAELILKECRAVIKEGARREARGTR